MSTRRRRPKGARPYPGPNRFDLDGEVFAKLLEDLENCLHDAGATLVDATELRWRVQEAVLWYDADLYMDDYFENLTLHELEDTLPHVIEILRLEANEHPVIMALGAIPDSHGAGSRTSPHAHVFDTTCVDSEHGIKRRKAVISDLEKIAAIPPPATRDRGRPKRGAVYRLVHRLAHYWSLAGCAFTSHWHLEVALSKKVPVSLGARFVYAVASFVDPEILPAVPKMMEDVVAERSQGIVMPWLKGDSRILGHFR
jgi:hypothetical protein